MMLARRKSRDSKIEERQRLLSDLDSNSEVPQPPIELGQLFMSLRDGSPDQESSDQGATLKPSIRLFDPPSKPNATQSLQPAQPPILVEALRENTLGIDASSTPPSPSQAAISLDQQTDTPEMGAIPYATATDETAGRIYPPIPDLPKSLDTILPKSDNLSANSEKMGVEAAQSIRKFLHEYPDINRSLRNAVRNGNIEKAQFLIECGADVNAEEYEVWPRVCGSSLNIAVETGTYEMIVFLLQQGARLDIFNPWGNGNLLYSAVERGSPEIVNLLLRSGANAQINEASTRGHCYTTLGVAVEKGNPEIVELLLRNGADEDNKKWSLEIAMWQDAMYSRVTPEREKYIEIVKLILENDVEPNFLLINERTSPQVVELMITHRCRIPGLNELNSYYTPRFSPQIWAVLCQSNPSLLLCAPVSDQLEKIIASMATENRLTIETLNKFPSLSLKESKHRQLLEIIKKYVPNVVQSFLCDTYFPAYRQRREENQAGETSFLRFFGISRSQKLAAADWLKAVLSGQTPTSDFEQHRKALMDGELGKIYGLLGRPCLSGSMKKPIRYI